MTKEERIKQLATQYRFCANNNQFIHSFPDCKEDIECIAEALEKQIPKKYKIVEGTSFGKQEFFAVCPSCDDGIHFVCGYGEKDTDEVIYEKWHGEKYCSKCGQKLDWR